MCRSTITEPARQPLAELLRHMAVVLADRVGANPNDVQIGPVDFGAAEEASPQ